MTKKYWASLDPFYEPGPFLGRIVANTGFLNALLRLDPYDEYHFFVSSEKVASHCQNYFRKKHNDILPKIKFLPRLNLIQSISDKPYYIFHLSDCINYPAHLARLRNKHSKRIFPITSITHSLSYSNYSHMLLKQLWPGWSVRDAIICSSDCGRLVLAKYFDRLAREYGLDQKFSPPLLKHIPLGIDSEKTYIGKSNQPTEKFISDDKTNILCIGRISCYSKMDILPILKSFQLARIYGLDTRAVRLILAGGMDQKDDTIKKLLLFAKNIGVELKIIPNPDEQTKELLLRDAHVFLSMSDNPQETFGITILEAQSAGLPVVTSDYNGYRELISHNKNGFLIPTLGPDKTEYVDDLAPLIFDSESHLLLAQSCAFDLHVLAETLIRLIADPELRKTTGNKGKANASQYSWDKIIRSYILFWDELNNLNEKKSLKDQKHPAHTSYSDIFSHYTTDSWINSIVSVSKLGQAVYREKDHLVIYSGLSDFLDKEKIRMLLFLSRAPIKTPTLIARLCAALDLDQDISRLIVSWAVKQGLLQTS